MLHSASLRRPPDSLPPSRPPSPPSAAAASAATTVLYSIPLRGLQCALIAFWSLPLRLGLVPTLLAVPAALFHASSETLADLHAVLLRRKIRPSHRDGFSILMRWLISFWVFVISYKQLGPLATVVLFAFGLLVVPTTTSAVKKTSFVVGRSKSSEDGRGNGAFFTANILKNLNTIVATGLIMALIVGVLAAGVFSSYKIGVEGKDAVISLKSHVQK